jgi:hypothetical protein
MTDKPVKIPAPNHPISIEANSSRVVVKVGGKIIADTSAALTLREASYPPVQYIPDRDVDMAALSSRSLVVNASARAFSHDQDPEQTLDVWPHLRFGPVGAIASCSWSCYAALTV